MRRALPWVTTALFAATTMWALSAREGKATAPPRELPPPGAAARSLHVAPSCAGVDEEDVLAELATARGPAQRAAALERLGILGTARSVPAVAAYVHDPRLGEIAIDSLGRIGGDEATDVLLGLIGDEATDEASSAVTALGEARTPAAFAKLAELVLVGPDALTSDALWALGWTGDPFALDVFRRALADRFDGQPGDVIEALALMGTPEAEAYLAELAASADVRVRAAALAVLAESDAGALDGLIAILDSDDAESVIAAAMALGKAGDNRALDALAAAAQRGTQQTRSACMMALADLGASGCNVLIGFLDGPDGDDAAAALSDVATADLELQKRLIAVARDGGKARQRILGLFYDVNTPEVSALMVSLLDGSGRDRSVALDWIERNGGEEAVAWALDHLHGVSDEQRAAAEILGRLGTPEVMAELRAAAATGSADAMRVLAGAAPNDPATVELLAAALHGPNMHAAAEYLGQIGTEEATEALLAALASNDTASAAAAAQALAEVPGQISAELATAARSSDHVVAVEALRALAQHDPGAAAPILADMLAGGDPELAAEAVELAASELSREQAADMLADAAVDGRAEVRRAAAEVLAQGPDGEQQLLTLAGDPDDGVRAAAFEGLAALGTPAATDAVVEAATRGTPTERASAYENLRSMDVDGMDDLLAQGVGDPDADVAVEAIRVAADQRGPASLDALARCFDDPNTPEEVRQAAAAALQIAGGPGYTSRADAIGDVLDGEDPYDWIDDGP